MNFTLSSRSEEGLLPSYLQVLTDTESPGKVRKSQQKRAIDIEGKSPTPSKPLKRTGYNLAASLVITENVHL